MHGGEEGWGVLISCRGRGRMAVDTSIAVLPGQGSPHRPGRQCLHQSRSAVRRLASRMKGDLHPTKNRS